MAAPNDNKPKDWRDLPTLWLSRGAPPSNPPAKGAPQVAYNVRSIETLVSELMNRGEQLFKGD